ncbi:glycosyltransferase family 4 protein [Mesonia mobilis]|uniref:Colanic acid biosynthesis glycosyltransferase WcaL n=1 Tax=Mesonia mobilis TaxID=369791 RepID=A0ABQ3BUX4_9FLAO|nr:glycosyltransferase family 4 protein [Mesonia mobilis]MBQ0739026.1 glycosyltransferase family 4 protein [Aquimarina celericrescens]GGZ53315.1 colanic acid biosynthesis glycosyltransferase WcaL [Mesonia mobilis]
MKIGIVLAQPPGYSETFFNSKINGLQAQGFEVTLFCQQNRSDFTACQVKTFPAKKRNPITLAFSFLTTYISLLPYLRRIVKWYRLEKPSNFIKFLKRVYLNAPLLKADLDWLHFGFTTMALGKEALAKVIGAQMAVSFRGYDINVYPKKHPSCYIKVWKHVDRVHAISNYLVKEAQKVGLHKSTSSHIITPAVNVNKLQELAPVTKINKSKLRLITIARMSWIKGLDFLIETASQLKEKGVDFEWLIIGDGGNQEKERYLFHAYEKNLTGELKFIGKKSHQETLTLLYSSDMYVQTSYNEGFCNAVLEAQALGKLCFAFDVGGLPENIIHKRTGWLVKAFDTIQLAEKIIVVSQLSVEEKYAISTQAIERVQTEFNIEKQQQAFVNFYQLPL